MNARRWVVGTALSLALLTGAAGTMAAQNNGAMPEQAGFGQCVSEMASAPGGGGLAGHHRPHHRGAEQSLGQHLETMRDGTCPMDHDGMMP